MPTAEITTEPDVQASVRMEVQKLLNRGRYKSREDWARDVLADGEPVELYRQPDGTLLLGDGNHRYFAATILGRDVPAIITGGVYEVRATRINLDPSNIKTRAVAGAAYKSNDIRSTLTHAVDQTTDKPLCGRVKPENILDDPYAVDDEDAPATCPACAKRDPRFNGSGVLRETREKDFGLFQIPVEEISFPGGFGADVTPLETNRGKPIIVVERNDDFRLIDGWGRTSGLLNAGVEYVQVIVVSAEEAADHSAGSEKWNEAMYAKYTPQFRYPGTTN